MNLSLIFSGWVVIFVGNAICLVVAIPSPHSKQVSSSTHSQEETVFLETRIHGDQAGESGEIGNVNKTEIGVIDRGSENAIKNNNSVAKTDNFGTIPEIISTTTVPPVIRKRATKVLRKPLESQLHYYQLPLEENSIRQDSHSSPAILVSNSSQTEGRVRVTPVRRQDGEGTSGPEEISFLSVVSPIEGSLGGLTGLQGLPPLNPVQFVKMLVALTPFIIPIIFIPLLIFTIGLLMIPVTRANVFVGGGDLRSQTGSFIPSFIWAPIKAFGDNRASSIVAIPRAFAYDLVDTEKCVERISCEIASRYLHSHWDNGNWRTIANSSWISRMINYWWNNSSTVSRIAKSLQVASHVEDAKDLRSERNLEENGAYMRSSSTLGTMGQCAQYVCSPKTLLKKFLSPKTPSSQLPLKNDES